MVPQNDNTESEFDKLLENQTNNEENNREDVIKAAVAAAVNLPPIKSVKKKTVRASSIPMFKFSNTTKVYNFCY